MVGCLAGKSLNLDVISHYKGIELGGGDWATWRKPSTAGFASFKEALTADVTSEFLTTTRHPRLAYYMTACSNSHLIYNGVLWL